MSTKEIKEAKFVQVELEKVMIDYSKSMINYLNTLDIDEASPAQSIDADESSPVQSIDALAFDLEEFSKTLKTLLHPTHREIRLKYLAREGFTLMMFPDLIDVIEQTYQDNVEMIIQIVDKGQVVCTLNSGDLVF